MKIVLVSKCSLDIEQYVELKCQFWYLTQRASLAPVGSHLEKHMAEFCTLSQFVRMLSISVAVVSVICVGYCWNK